MTDQQELTVNHKESADHIINVENNRHRNYAMIIVVTTICVTVLLFALGMVINMVKYKNPIDGGVIGTTLTPLIEIFKIILGVS